jgi:EAL domain-containing protein (putative c-di-GMP-specific phosphodiesterase class I)
MSKSENARAGRDWSKALGHEGPAAPGPSQPTARERLGRALTAVTSTGTWPAIGLVVLGIICAWYLTYRAGGTRTAVPHTFYLPIVFAASRFRWPGAVLTALVSGLVGGPLMLFDVAAGIAQPTSEWAERFIAFLAIGLLVAGLSGASRKSIGDFVRDARGVRELHQALARDEFEAHYQPLVDLKTEQLVGFEALCRWRHSTQGLIPPVQFIPFAERTGALLPIGAFMLKQAVEQGARWQAAQTGDLVMAVNISADQLCHPDFVGDVVAALGSAGLSPRHLSLEITETALITDRQTAIAHVDALHGLGVQIALDDFGTGHSSLAYLQDFQIDVIKIDQSFVSRVDLDPKCAVLVAAIIELAHALGAVTIGEGIERQTQQDALRALGCDQGQGYLLGKPGRPLQVGQNGTDAARTWWRPAQDLAQV